MITHNSNQPSSPPPATSPPSTPPLRNLLRVFYRHRRKMAVVFFLVFGLLVSAVLLLPRSYRSESQIFLRLGKESVALDPTATMNEVVNVHETRESEINSEMEILRSRVLLEDVVARLGTQYILSGSDKSDKQNASGEGSPGPLAAVRTWISGDVSATDRAIDRLDAMIEVDSPRKSSVVHLTCKARSPEHAQRILEEFLTAYIARHTSANRTSGSHDFFAKQSELLGERLSRVDQEIRDAKDAGGLASVEGELANVEQQASVIELAILENARELASAESRIAKFKSTLQELPERELAEESIVPSNAADDMQNEFYKVQIIEKELRSRFTESHPAVVAARRHVKEMRQILESQEPSRKQPTHKLSAVRQSLQIELATAEADAAAAHAESKLLHDQFEAVQSRVREINEEGLRLSQLSRKAELLEDSYRRYSGHREQARINAALESQHISNVNVVQPPSYISKPSLANVRRALGLALVLATLLSVLVALGFEHFDPSLKSPEQTEAQLGVPVLFSVPQRAQNDLIQS